MTATSADVFDQGLDFFDGVAAQVGDDQWDNPSPCEDWTALDVLGHLCTSLGMGTSILKGQQPSWPDVARPAASARSQPWTNRSIAGNASPSATVRGPIGVSRTSSRLAPTSASRHSAAAAR